MRPDLSPTALLVSYPGASLGGVEVTLAITSLPILSFINFCFPNNIHTFNGKNLFVTDKTRFSHLSLPPEVSHLRLLYILLDILLVHLELHMYLEK